MKSVLLILAIAILTAAQSPIPIPGLNNQAFSGNWYMIYMLGNNAQYLAQTSYCYEWSIFFESSTVGFIQVEDTTNSNYYNFNTTLSVYISGSVWNLNDKGYVWIGVDPVSESWATLASTSSQAAFIVSRTPNLSNVVLNSQLLLLQAEGYSVNGYMSNGAVFNNNEC